MGKAYRCFASPDELEAERKSAVARGVPFRYERARWQLTPGDEAARLGAGAPYVIRFAVPDEELAWDDAVHGRISFQGRDIDDFVILRSDGSAIYNLAVVSDDIDMRITHVIRGDDHISNTPKQVALYRALGAPEPVFAHVPMILGSDGKKLSKRHGATAVGDYQDQGIMPEAMRNFLALLGWSPGDDREIMTDQELVEHFSLEGIQKKPAVFDTTKLEWMNGQYLSRLPAGELLAPVERQLARLGVAAQGRDLHPLIDAAKARSRTVTHLAEQVALRIDGSRVTPDDKVSKLVAKMGPAYAASLGMALDVLEPIPEASWRAETLLDALKGKAESTSVKLGDLLQPVRAALTGSTVSEPVNELLAVVGRDESLARLRRVVAQSHLA